MTAHQHDHPEQDSDNVEIPPEQRCKNCPFVTKSLAHIGETQKCKHYEQGCRELKEYELAMLLACM